MKILIDIGHPAHVHLLKNFAFIMQKRGHSILFTCREKEFEIDLMKSFGFEFISFGKPYKSILGKIKGMLEFDYKITKVALKFKPDIFLSSGSIYASHASFLLRKPHITLEDTENMEQIRLYKPFSKLILTPDAIPQKYGKKQLRYKGFHQSAFLHPNHFKKNTNYKNELGVDANDKVFLLRLVALNATHDLNVEGISEEMVYSLVDLLKEKGRLFISSEKPLQENLEQFRLQIPADKIHDFISICDLVIGESSTMSNEAGYLGIPNIFFEDIELNVLRKYIELGLKIQYKELNQESLSEIKSLVNNIEEVKKSFKENSDKYIKESIDLTEFIIETVESNIK